VAVVSFPHAPRQCRYALVVNLSGRVVSYRLREGLLAAKSRSRVGSDALIATLIGFALIDKRPGAEILIRLNEGAASSGIAVYSLTRHGIVNLRVPTHDGLLWEAQSSGYSAGVDCVAPGTGVIAATYSSRRGGVDRTIYALTGNAFTVVSVQRHLRRGLRGLFASCRAR
jgi:hypothetical protein